MNFSQQSGDVNFQPSRKADDNAFVDSPSVVTSRAEVSGFAERRAIEKKAPFKQAGEFYRNLDEQQQANLISNLAGDLGRVQNQEVKEIMVSHFYLADTDYGARLAKAVDVDLAAIKARAETVRQASL